MSSCKSGTIKSECLCHTVCVADELNLEEEPSEHGIRIQLVKAPFRNAGEDPVLIPASSPDSATKWRVQLF